MISKLGTSLLVAAIALFIAAPTTAFALTPAQQKQLKKYKADLAKLKNRAAPASRVKTLVTNIAKLDPLHADASYRTGLTKLALTKPNKTQAKQLANTVVGLVRKSTLKAAQKNKVIKNVNLYEKKFSPTPISPRAMLVPSVIGIYA